GIIFFAFVGGLSLIEPYLESMEASRNVVAGLLAVVMLVGVEWLVRRFRGYGMSFFAGERRQMYQAVQQLQEQMRTILDYEALAQRAVDVVGRSFGTRSAVIFFRPTGAEGPWITASYHPEAPYLTQRTVSSVWAHLGKNGRIWARNPELNETAIPNDLHQLLLNRGVALLVPIMGEEEPVGIIALGLKWHRRSVYNLEEVDLLRSLSGQLALAVERLNLVEREKALVRESAEAQLAALRAQINPHFLFNSLNTIVSLIEERPEEAEAIVEHLASIFRYILQTGGRAFVTMEDEFELIRHYLSIEQSRFAGSLTVDLQLEPEFRHHPVPAFAIQTLVENAVKHGLARRRGGGTVSIRCSREDEGILAVSVSDTGVGIADIIDRETHVTGHQPFFGIGLKNVSSRLEQLYGRADLLRIRSSPETGTTASIHLPDDQGLRNGFDADVRSRDDESTP
ncbi:MAG: histidine kinase, partial [Rhodothermales bacterium]